jgi:hypothetical protein
LGELKPTVDLRSTLKDLPPDKLSKELFLRMLFSCLVDADYLDTEEHFEGKQREKTQGVFSNYNHRMIEARVSMAR